MTGHVHVIFSWVFTLPEFLRQQLGILTKAELCTDIKLVGCHAMLLTKKKVNGRHLGRKTLLFTFCFGFLDCTQQKISLAGVNSGSTFRQHGSAIYGTPTFGAPGVAREVSLSQASPWKNSSPVSSRRCPDSDLLLSGQGIG